MNISKKIPSDLKFIPEFMREFIEEISKLPFNKEQIHDIKLSMEEALVNAIKHGNESDPRLEVQISAETNADSLAIIVADQGKGFNFRDIPDPRLPENLRNLSGRGVLLIRNHMDNVEFLESGSKIKMTKLFLKGGKK